jgi:hypothetical protein
MFVRLMLWLVESRVLEFKESFGNVVGHVEVDGPGRIIPVNVNAANEGAVPVHGDGVMFFQSGPEMKDLVARCGFDAKVVNYETEADVLPHVAPYARCVLAMVVPLCIESLFE